MEARRNPPYTVTVGDAVLIRQATSDDAPAIHTLITGHLDEGHLLPRQLGEIEVHASRFVVAVEDGEIVGCVDLAPLSRTVAEIRSLVVSEPARCAGIGRRLIDSLILRARIDGFQQLCAFTHVPSFFVRLGFSLVPHEWVPEKISTDCASCRLFRTCGQYAVMRHLSRHG
jgi:amino-acid N-acetyltransferase